MCVDGLSFLAEEPLERNPLRDEAGQARFRSLLGMVMYVALNTRPDALFATVAVSQWSARQTRNAWKCLLRLSHYLVLTKHLYLTYRRPARGRWRKPG